MRLCKCGCGQPAGVWPKTYGRLGVKKGDPMAYVHGHFNRKDISQMFTVDPGKGCWNWAGNIEGGYGRIGQRLAYRVFYEQRHGRTRPGFELDHLCRNRACVNPDHLEPVTKRENVRRGANTKLTVAIVVDIKRAIQASRSNGDIAKEFGLGTSHVSRIRHGLAWADVEVTA